MNQAVFVLMLCAGATYGQFHMDQNLKGILEKPLQKLKSSSQWKSLGDLARNAEIPADVSDTVKSVLEAVESDKEFKPPKFCNDLECPPFTEAEKPHEDYELRNYSKSTWVTTHLSGVDYVQATEEMFKKLFAYISDAHILMTCPVLVRIKPGQGPACESDFTMSFYLNDTLGKAGPPTPKDKSVYISTMPDNMLVYVKSFSGYDMFSVKPWIEQAGKLAESIGDPTKYDQTHYFTAGYDSPFRIFNRHNEIWFLKV